jgi:hypothetical protein
MEVSEIQKLIRDTTKQRKWEWENGYIEKSLKTLKAIQDLQLAFALIIGKSLTVHLKTVSRMREEIHIVMPGIKSKFQEQRLKLIRLVDVADKFVTGDAFRPNPNNHE